MTPKKTITITVDDEILVWIKKEVEKAVFSSVSHAVRYAVKQLMKQE